MLSKEQNVKDPIAIGCDATDDDSSNSAGYIKAFSNLLICIFSHLHIKLLLLPHVTTAPALQHYLQQLISPRLLQVAIQNW